MKIAEIYRISNQASIATKATTLPGKELFQYLDNLVSLFLSAGKNSFASTQIDLNEPLDQVQTDLAVDRVQTITQEAELDFKKVQNLNLIDFASFLDTVIRNTAKQNPMDTQLANIASRNIFRTHVNKRVSEQLSTMFYEDPLEPWTNAYIDSLADSQAGCEAQGLFDTMSDTTRNHLYIFDIDGTLKLIEETCLSHDIPNLDDQLINNLLALNRRPDSKVLMLTSRSKEEILESNIPHQHIPVYVGYGRELIDESGCKSIYGQDFIAETQKYVNHIDSLLQNLNIKKDEYKIKYYAGAIQINFIGSHFAEQKQRSLQALKLLSQSSSKWTCTDSGGRDVFFNTPDVKSNKGISLKRILESHNNIITNNTNIYVFGDTGTDYKAMEALKEIDLPQGARAINIAVGNQLAGKPAVDIELNSHHVVADLLNWLAVETTR